MARLSGGLGSDALEIGLGIAELVRIAEDRQHESIAMRINAHEVLSPVHDHLPDCHLAGLRQRLPNDDVALLFFAAAGRARLMPPICRRGSVAPWVLQYSR